MKRFLMILAVVAAGFSLRAVAGNTYPFRIISGTTTGLVDELEITNSSAITLSITNWPTGGRRAFMGILGAGGGGGGGGDATALSNTLVSAINSTNDALRSTLNGSFTAADLALSNTLSSTAQASLLATAAVLQAEIAALPVASSVALLASSNVYSANTTQQMDVVTANVGTFAHGSLGGWTTNTSGFAIIVVRGSDGSDTYNVDGTKVVLVASNNTFSATNNFTGPVFLKGSVVVSNDLSATAAVNAGSLNGALNGTNLTGNGTIGTNLLQATGASANTYGSSSQVGQFTLNDRGQVVSAGNVAISTVNAIATNAISLVVANGTSNSPLVTLIFSNLDVHVINANTSIVGFASVPFYTINGLHGSTLTLSNFNTQGLTLTNNSTARIDLGGAISNLVAVGGGYIAIASNNTSNLQINTSPGMNGLTFGGGISAGGGLVQLKTGGSGQVGIFQGSTADGNGEQLQLLSGQSQAGFSSMEWGGFSTYGGLWVDMNAGKRGWYFDGGTLTGGGAFTWRAENRIADPERPAVNTNFVRHSFPYRVGGGKTNLVEIGAALPFGSPFMSGFTNSLGILFWFGTGASTNIGNFSDPATDAKEFATNSVFGFINAGVLSNAWTNIVTLVLKDETNGMRTVTVSTNFGGSIYVGPTNNIFQTLLAGGPTTNMPVTGSTLYLTNGQLVGTSSP